MFILKAKNPKEQKEVAEAQDRINGIFDMKKQPDYIQADPTLFPVNDLTDEEFDKTGKIFWREPRSQPH